MACCSGMRSCLFFHGPGVNANHMTFLCQDSFQQRLLQMGYVRVQFETEQDSVGFVA